MSDKTRRKSQLLSKETPQVSQSTLKPLEGIRVLDFTNVPPGAACGTLLADLGAEVIRIESPKLKGKPSLVIGQVALSRAKKSMTLDMRSTAANEILLRIAPQIDVVIENAWPNVMAERGFGFPQASAANAGLIWCAITGFGQDGPYARHSGHDISYLAHSGLLGALTQDRNWHPGLPVTLQAGAMSAVAAIEAALIRKLRTGKGAYVDISLSESATWFLNCGINPVSDRAFSLPETPDRRLYRCADDRYLAVACAEPRTWQALCEGLGCADLAGELHKWSDMAATIDRLASLFAQKGAAEWVKLLAPLGAAVTVLNHATQLLEDPHIMARGSLVEVAGCSVPANPLRLDGGSDGATGTALAEPPLTGADTAEMLQLAGYSEDQIESMEQAGLI